MLTRKKSPVVRLWICSLVLALTLNAPGVPPAHAATLTVTTNADSGAGSLRQTIAAASSGDTINFDNDYTITLASQLDIIDKTITITGAGHHITISGNNAVRVFHVGQSVGSGNLTLDHLNIVNGKSTVEECAGSAVSCGGGLMLEYLTTATVLNSTFANNDGGLVGGAIYSYYGNPLTVSNSTFINNHAVAYAGAIQVFYGSATLTNNTFTGNSATNPGGYGGAILNNWGTVTFRNNIFSGNSATNGGNCDNSGGTFNDGGGNVVWGDTTDCPGVNANPLLGTLGNYGGDTPTIPLLPGSAAIDAATANCPATDQRGVTRTATCDSGAYESRGFTLTKAGGDNQSTPISTAFTLPLSVTLSETGGNVLSGVSITFTAPTSGASLAAPTTVVTTTNTGGNAALSASANGLPGSYTVKASASSTLSVTFALTNLKRTSTSSVTSSPNPSVSGQAVTFTATVTSTVGTPTGNITFTLDTANSVQPLVNGVATYVTTTLSPGHHTVTVDYGGDATFTASTGLLSGGQDVVDAAITGLSAINSGPTRLTDLTVFTATIGTGTNVGYQWDFGDGQTAGGIQVTHRYTQTGTYTATVTATNSVGSINATTLVTIEPVRLYLPLMMRN